MWLVNYSLVYLQECGRPNAHITQTIKVPNLLTRKETPNTDEILFYLSCTLRSAPLADFLSFYTLWRSAVSYRGTQLCETPGSLERNPSFRSGSDIVTNVCNQTLGSMGISTKNPERRSEWSEIFSPGWVSENVVVSIFGLFAKWRQVFLTFLDLRRSLGDFSQDYFWNCVKYHLSALPVEWVWWRGKLGRHFVLKSLGRINGPVLEISILHHHVKFSQIELYVILFAMISRKKKEKKWEWRSAE